MIAASAAPGPAATTDDGIILALSMFLWILALIGFGFEAAAMRLSILLDIKKSNSI